LPLGTPATAPGDNTVTGTAEFNQLATPVAITAATKLSGAAGTDSVTPSFAAGDTITIDGATYTFSASPTNLATNTINVGDTVGTLMGVIQTATGVAPSITGGAITLHTGTAANLTITTGGTVTATNALAALGFSGGGVTLSRTPAGTVGTGTVIGNDLQTFLNESISGGAVTAYDSTGTAVNVQLRWAKTDSAALGGSHTNTWNLFYQSNPNATGSQTAWVNAGTNFTFGPTGVLTSPATPAITIPNVSVGNQSLGNLSFSMGAGTLTQFASTGGTVTINTITQNGFAAGQLQSVAINNNGIVVGTFSNGQNLDLASVTLSHFNGTNYLKSLDGGAYAVTDQSGPAIIGASGSISGSSLEGSNTDIASEFTKLIVTQQAYSANTKVITTANSMVQDLLNVLR